MTVEIDVQPQHTWDIGVDINIVVDMYRANKSKASKKPHFGLNTHGKPPYLQ